MFEPISQSLYEIMMFSVLGFILAAIYEPVRIIRMFVKTGALAAGIQDFLFLSAAGVIVFAYSLEFSVGYFRYFYILGVAFGATVYFLTAGKFINYVMRRFSDAVKRCILRPLRKIMVKIAQKSRLFIVRVYKLTEKRGKDLKNALHIKYNNRVQAKLQARKAAKLRREIQANIKTPENQNEAIKARVVRVFNHPKET
jgi:hypothetical protein